MSRPDLRHAPPFSSRRRSGIREIFSRLGAEVPAPPRCGGPGARLDPPRRPMDGHFSCPTFFFPTAVADFHPKAAPAAHQAPKKHKNQTTTTSGRAPDDLRTRPDPYPGEAFANAPALRSHIRLHAESRFPHLAASRCSAIRCLRQEGPGGLPLIREGDLERSNNVIDMIGGSGAVMSGPIPVWPASFPQFPCPRLPARSGILAPRMNGVRPRSSNKIEVDGGAPVPDGPSGQPGPGRPAPTAAFVAGHPGVQGGRHKRRLTKAQHPFGDETRRRPRPWRSD